MSSEEQPHQNPLSPLSPDNSEGLPPMAQDLSELDEQNCNTLESSGAKLPWLDIETSSLVQNAQKLLQSVSATLHRTEKVAVEESTACSEKPTSVQYFQIQQPDATEAQLEGERSRERSRRSCSRSRSTTAHKSGRVIERRYSYDVSFGCWIANNEIGGDFADLLEKNMSVVIISKRPLI